jgi:hypothetical protein
MVSDTARKRLPPYVSYRTFQNFLERLEQGIPSRLDRSYWGETLSGSTGVHLMAALRFLGLIDANYTPTARLRRLVSTKGELKAELLKEMTYEAYDFLLRGSFDLQTATYAQLQEVFYDRFQSTSDVNRKCIKFFVALATAAGIPLSPFIAKRFRSSYPTSGTKTVIKRISAKSNRNLTVPQQLEEIPRRMSWEETLLAKFPAFDPAWSDEVKLNWFKAFDELLKLGLTPGGK